MFKINCPLVSLELYKFFNFFKYFWSLVLNLCVLLTVLFHSQIESNAAQCPLTMELINSELAGGRLDGSAFGNVCFSAIEPNTVIPPHYGPTNARTRCHLGKYATGWSRLCFKILSDLYISLYQLLS